MEIVGMDPTNGSKLQRDRQYYEANSPGSAKATIKQLK